MLVYVNLWSGIPSWLLHSWLLQLFRVSELILFTLSGLGFAEYNYLLPRPLSDTYLIPPAARPVDPLAVPTPITDLPTSSLPFYANFKPCIFPSPSSPTSPTFSNSVLGSYGLENYDIPSNGRPCTPPTLRSPVDHKIEEGYLDMNSAGELDIYIVHLFTNKFKTCK